MSFYGGPPRGPGGPPFGMPHGMAPPMGMPAGGFPPYGGMPPGGMNMPPGGMPGVPPFMAPPFMQQPPQALPRPAAPPPLPSPDDPSNWSEHTSPDGRKYYYNKVTRVSTYEKPPALINAATPPKPPPVPACRWKEYTAPDGKKYYSDGVSSLWEEPEELKAYKARLNGEEPVSQGGVEVVEPPAKPEKIVDTIEIHDNEDSGGEDKKSPVKSAPVEPPKPSPKVVVKEEDEVQAVGAFGTPEEAVAAFKAMLSDCKISSTAKWNEVQKSCQKEKRWNALKTMGERKQAFAEYQTKRLKDEREEKRQRARRARDSFLKMLAECEKISTRTRWREAQEILEDDARYNTAELDDRDKEEIFNDFVTELAKKEKEERRALKNSFGEFLRTFADRVTYKTNWREMQEILAESDDPKVDLVEESDQKLVFEDYIMELEKKYEEQKRLEKEERRKQEKQNRENFREFLKQKASKGEIHSESRWKDAKGELEEEEVYKAMDGQGGPTQREVFEQVVDELRDQFRDDKRVIRDIGGRTFDVKHDMTFEDYLAKLKAMVENVDDDTEDGKLKDLKAILEKREMNIKLLYQELHEKAVAIFKEEQRIREKRFEKYRELLADYYYRSDHVGMDWEEAMDELDRKSAYQALDAEDRKRLFDEHMADLESKMKKKTKHQAELLEKAKAEAAAAGEEGEVAEGGEQAPVTGENGKAPEAATKEDDESDEERSHKKKKKDKKKHKEKKKHKDKDHHKEKKRKHRDRSHSRDSSDDEDEPRKKKKRSSRKRSRSDSRDGWSRSRSRSPSRKGRRHHDSRDRRRGRSASSESASSRD